MQIVNSKVFNIFDRSNIILTIAHTHTHTTHTHTHTHTHILLLHILLCLYVCIVINLLVLIYNIIIYACCSCFLCIPQYSQYCHIHCPQPIAYEIALMAMGGDAF